MFSIITLYSTILMELISNHYGLSLNKTEELKEEKIHVKN